MVDRKTRIVYISLYTEMGGGEYGLYYLVKHLDRDRFDPVVVVNADGPLVGMLREIGVETVMIPFDVVMLKEALTGRSFGKNFRAARHLRAYLTLNRPGIVQISDVLSLLLLLPAMLTMRLRIVFSVIFFYEWPRAILLNILALFFVNRIVFLSKMLRDDLGRKTVGLARRFQTIYWGVDTSRFSPIDDNGRIALRKKLGLPVDKKIVGFIGRYDVWKGHLTFLEAAMLVIRERDDVVFLMVGGAPTGKYFPKVDTYKRNIDEWIASHPLGDRLIVWGHRDDVPDIMRSLDVFVCSSDSEPFGLVIIEALATGRLVVVSRTIGALEVVEQSPGLFVAEPNDPISFRQMTVEALVSKEVDQVPSVMNRYTWESYAQEYAKIYSESIYAKISYGF